MNATTWLLAIIIQGDLFVVETGLDRERCLAMMAATETTICLPSTVEDLLLEPAAEAEAKPLSF